MDYKNELRENIPFIFDTQNFQGIYYEPIFDLPTDDQFRFSPSEFNGPKNKARRFHSFPRFGYTNDITSLIYFLDTGNSISRLNISDIINEKNTININGEPIIEIAIPRVSTKEYNSQQDANEYVRGIAAVGIMIFALYLIWGVWLLLLRAGRMDCCFRLCQRRGWGRTREATNDDYDEGDNPGEDCYCHTCHETLAVKGGCCTRHIFCGWMSGRPVKLPTRQSISREKQLRNNSLIKSGIQVVGNGVHSVGRVVGSRTNGAMTKITSSSDSQDNVVTETAVIATEDEVNEYVSEELLSRQQSARRTILVLRIIFLLSSTLVLICSCVLLVRGWHGINNVVNSSKNTLQIVEGQLESAMDGVEGYIDQAEQLKQKRIDFLNRTTGVDKGVENSNTISGRLGWCPASVDSGKIEVVVPLSQLLLRGNLIKLAFAEDVSGAARNIAGNINSTEAVGAGKEQTVTVVTFLDGISRGGIVGEVLGLKDITNDGIDGNSRIALIVVTLKRNVKTLVVRLSDDESQRFIKSSKLNSLRESVVTKDGAKYTVLQLVNDGGNPTNSIGNELIYRSYNLTGLLNSNITLTVDISTLTTAVNERLSNVSKRILDIFSTLNTGLQNVHVQSQDAQAGLDSFLPYYYVAVVFVCFIMLLTCVFIIGVILAWKEKQPRLFRHMQDRIICPIFILSSLFMWIFTTVFLTLGVFSGDFCFNSPDVQVTKMLERYFEGTSTIAFNFGYYYVNGCPLEFQPRLMSVTFKIITSAWNGMGQFGGLLKSIGAGPLSRACGLDATTPAVENADNPIQALSALTFAITEHFQYAAKAIFSLADLLLCRSFSPLYTSLTYDIVCTEFINMVSPMLWCMFIISVCSMIMITLRVAWHEFVPDGLKNNENEVMAEHGDVKNGDSDAEGAAVVEESGSQAGSGCRDDAAGDPGSHAKNKNELMADHGNVKNNKSDAEGVAVMEESR